MLHGPNQGAKAASDRSTALIQEQGSCTDQAMLQTLVMYNMQPFRMWKSPRITQVNGQHALLGA